MAELDPTIRRSITPATSEIISEYLELWEDDTSELFIGRTFFKGPQSLILDIGKEIEDNAWDVGKRAADNCHRTDPQVNMVRENAIVIWLCIGRELQGKVYTCELVRKEVQAHFTP